VGLQHPAVRYDLQYGVIMMGVLFFSFQMRAVQSPIVR
jgi:hypothetical protein